MYQELIDKCQEIDCKPQGLRVKLVYLATENCLNATCFASIRQKVDPDQVTFMRNRKEGVHDVRLAFGPSTGQSQADSPT